MSAFKRNNRQFTRAKGWFLDTSKEMTQEGKKAQTLKRSSVNGEASVIFRH